MSGPVLPTRVQDFLAFCNHHGDVWDDAPTTIGLTAAQVTAFKTKVGITQGFYDAQQAAIEESRSATVKANAYVADLRAEAAELVRFIKAYAQSQAVPADVYSAAEISPPAPPAPAAAPGQANDFHAELNGDGFITLKWKAPVTGNGTVVWLISRKIDAGAFTSVGVSGERAFTDETIPLGSTSVSYKVQGQRGQTLGPVSFPFTLQFGVDGGGGLTVLSQESKMAA